MLKSPTSQKKCTIKVFNTPIIYDYLFLLSTGEKFIYSSMPSHVSRLTLNCLRHVFMCVCVTISDLEELKKQSESSTSRKCSIVHTAKCHRGRRDFMLLFFFNEAKSVRFQFVLNLNIFLDVAHSHRAAVPNKCRML